MKKIIIGILLFLLGAGSAKVTAHGIYHPVNGRHHMRHNHIREQKRIYHGVRTGALTPHEMEQLEMQQARIRHDKRRAKADGIVTSYERAAIRSEQAKASRNIYRQKHDGQYRF